jgi:energy-coupling factor transport system ATP-binding protein
MALIADGLTYTYGAGTSFSVPALDGVHLTVERGELVVVAGTTGSGKSTLLRLLAGVLAPTGGSATVDGVPTTAPSARGRVALVFQNPEAQFFAETVLADVSFGPRNLGAEDPGAVAREALAQVGLDPEAFAPRSPFTLSGGEARRVAIAGALAMRAPYLLLDEPTAGLDRAGRQAVLASIAAERERAGVVVVTHDPGEVLADADRVVALARGAVASSGTVQELLAGPAAYEGAGLRLPDVVRAQLLAIERGALVARVEFEPERAAAVLADARGAES